MNDKNKPEENTIAENLAAVGQIILGEVEKIGGILTGDPITNAEGDYNIGAGATHQETNRSVLASENEAETIADNDFARNENDSTK